MRHEGKKPRAQRRSTLDSLECCIHLVATLQGDPTRSDTVAFNSSCFTLPPHCWPAGRR